MSKSKQDRIAELEKRLTKLEQERRPAAKLKAACSRREFAYAGLLAAGTVAGLSGRATAQTFAEDYHGIAVLIGDDADKPDPNGDLITGYREYNFMFFSKDTGEIHTLQTGNTSWIQFGSAIRPGASEAVNLGFDIWRTPSTKFFTLVELSINLDSGTANDAQVDLLVDEGGGETADYTFTLSLSADLPDNVVEQATLWIPKNGSYRINNAQDPNGNNSIDIHREFDL